MKIKTLYGTYTIDEPVLQELINCPAMQRLKHIHQHGISAYLKKESKYFSRYDHSIGVLVLLKQYNTLLEEQISGLLHDVSHTVFSHVGDILFKHTSLDYSYQDIIHKTFLEKTEIKKILQKYGYSLDDILHKKGGFPALEQDLPNICADRLDYNLQEGMLVSLITNDDLKKILHHLYFENNEWVFNDVDIAKQFASISLYMTKNHFAAPWNILTYQWAAKALQRALDIDLISLHEVHFSTDNYVWEKLKNTDDHIIKKHMFNIIHYDQLFTPACKTNYDLHIKAKFRGINPYVKTTLGIQRLCDLDSAFDQQYNQTKNLIIEGHYISFTNSYHPANPSINDQKSKTIKSYQ